MFLDPKSLEQDILALRCRYCIFLVFTPRSKEIRRDDSASEIEFFREMVVVFQMVMHVVSFFEREKDEY